MTLNGLSKALAEQLGKPDFEPAPDGSMQIFVDHEGPIEISPDPGHSGFLFSATVGRIPRHGREAAFAEMLEANLEGQGTAGGCLSIDPELQDIVLCRCYRDPNISFEAFERLFIEFVKALRFWRGRHAVGDIGALAMPTPVTNVDANDAEQNLRSKPLPIELSDAVGRVCTPCNGNPERTEPSAS